MDEADRPRLPEPNTATETNPIGSGAADEPTKPPASRPQTQEQEPVRLVFSSSAGEQLTLDLQIPVAGPEWRFIERTPEFDSTTRWPRTKPIPLIEVSNHRDPTGTILDEIPPAKILPLNVPRGHRQFAPNWWGIKDRFQVGVSMAQPGCKTKPEQLLLNLRQRKLPVQSDQELAPDKKKSRETVKTPAEAWELVHALVLQPSP